MALSRRVFDKYDADHSGFISLSELRSLCIDMGYALSEDAVEVALVRLQTPEHPGLVSYESFLHWWRTEVSNYFVCVCVCKGKFYGFYLSNWTRSTHAYGQREIGWREGQNDCVCGHVVCMCVLISTQVTLHCVCVCVCASAVRGVCTCVN